MNLFRKDARPATVAEPEPAPDPPDVEALLDRALGEPLAAAALLALARAQHGLPCGRLGKSYSSQYEAAVDSTLAYIEQQLAEAKDAQRRSVAAAPRAELQQLLGDDEPARAAVARAATIEQLESRAQTLRTLASLAKRAALLRRYFDAKDEVAELTERIATHKRHEHDRVPPSICGPHGDGVHDLGKPRPPRPTSWGDAHYALEQALQREEANLLHARLALDEWHEQNVELSASITFHKQKRNA